MELNFGFGEKTLAPNPQLFAGVLEFVKEVLKGISMDIVFTPLFFNHIHEGEAEHFDPKVLKAEEFRLLWFTFIGKEKGTMVGQE
jgi:hypothetical protein